MCLGIPGEVIEIEEPSAPAALVRGTISFGGVRKQICLAYVPEARVGDYVVVHAGFALSVIAPERARAVFEDLGLAHEIPR
jgi:hydrogenase expression/formation protein HypC